MIEREKTYLAKYIPEDLKKCKKKELLDIYFPKEAVHSHLRLRQNGDKYELTKKCRLIPDDASSLIEQTIDLTRKEFLAFARVEGKRVRKIRCYLEYGGRLLEVDIFQDELAGLVLVDVEFETEKEKLDFKMPSFCLAEVTQEDFIAGGMLCGKGYADIEKDLARFGYNKL